MIATAASAQTQLVSEDIMVKSPDAGIEIFVRNKRPANMTSFRPERTVVYVHGATYPASTAFDLKLDGVSWMEYIASRGYDVYLLDLRGYGKSTRPKEMAEDGKKQSADRARRHRRQGHRHGGRLRARAPQHPAREPARLVVGHDPDGDLHDAEQRQGRAARALRAVMDPRDALAGAGGARPAAGLSHRVARLRDGPLAHRRARGQEGERSFRPAGSTPGPTPPGRPIRRARR